MLWERDEERAALEALLAAAASGQGGLVVLEGPAGIGKTQLLLAAADAAPALGLQALVARAGELERDFAFGVARQLLEPPVLAADDAQRAALLHGPARRAAAVLDLADAEDTEPSAAAHGLYWLVANLAAERPLLIAVDDLHWADGPSVRFLGYLTRRLSDLPVAVVCTLRAGEPLDAALEALLADAARLRPGPLSPAAVAALVAERLGPHDSAFAAACRRRTGGNPFLLAELLAELRERGAEAVDDVVPERVGLAVRRRLAALGEDAQALARALVILGDGADLGLAGSLAGLRADAAAGAAARLGEADLVETGLRFRHPLVRAAVAEGIGEPERGRGHARAARLLAEHGERPARVAIHLLASPPGDGDPWAVEALREAARATRRQGAPEHGVALLRRALSEPAEAGVRPALLRELGRAELAAMDAAAAEHLRAAHDLERDPGERAAVALELAVAHYAASRHLDAVDVLHAALDELGDFDRERRLQLEAFLATAGRYDLATERAVRGRIHAVAAELRGETAGERLVLAVAASENPGPRAEGLERAAELLEGVVAVPPWPDPSEGIGTVMMYLHAGRPERARALAETMLERARRADSPSRYALALSARGGVNLDVGALEEAEADMSAALDDLLVRSQPVLIGIVGGLVLALTERGSLAEAQALLERHGLDGELPERMIVNPLLHARATLRLAEGDRERAAADALELGRRHELWGMRRPSPNWRALAAEALRDSAEAGELADASLALAREWGTPKALGVALRARALVAGDAAELQEALAVLRGTPWRLEEARVGTDLGAALRRANRRREAREHLTAAMDLASRCGAALLAERAATELRATGARPRRHAVTGRDALTASERRVAALAAEGHSNREIAQALFVTVATVETHLRRVYRKLGAEGRGGLPAALGAGEDRS